MTIEAQTADNPLKKYFRQPKLYVELPSQGRFYPTGAIEVPDTGQYPVYSMTARDELTFKTPDALLNGQATVEVIQSCFPNIKNAWQMPSIDIDAVLIALRIATYGEDLSIDITIPGTDIEKTYQTDLRVLLDQISVSEYNEVINYNGMTIYIRPLTYQEFTKQAMKTFEEQRIIAMVNNDNLTEEDKLVKFQQSFAKLTDLTVAAVTQGIYKIEVDGEVVSDTAFISEFISNADSGLYTAVTDHLEKQKENFSIKPLTVTTSDEERTAGAPDTFEVPISFDASNFFVSRS